MNSTWPFGFVDRNLVHIDKREEKNLRKMKQVRSLGVEMSLKHVRVGNKAAMSPAMAEASVRSTAEPFIQRKGERRVFKEVKIRIKPSAHR